MSLKVNVVIQIVKKKRAIHTKTSMDEANIWLIDYVTPVVPKLFFRNALFWTQFSHCARK